MATAHAPVSSAASSQTNNSASSKPNPLLYKIKITLNDFYHRPRGGRWRRVVVPANFSLLELHVVIQLVFGWENYHLHHFMPHGFRNPRRRMPSMQDFMEYKVINEYGPDDEFQECRDERVYKLSDVFSEEDPKLEYEYDFGACWQHEVKFEGVVEANAELEYPACVAGKWANRVEDGNDTNEEGDLLPGFEGKQFDLEGTQQKLRKVFAGKWPLKVDNTTLKKCYLCGYYACSACNGKCCKYCLKADVFRSSAPVSNGDSGSSSSSED